MLGNNMCEVVCIDGKDRQCVIRGKFSGRGKRQNKLSKGIWVLVGLRDWEVSSKKRCDWLEVYSESDRNKIMKNENYDFAGFLQYDENNNFEDNLNFVNVIESDDENVNKSEDYFNFESSDSELDDTNNEKSEILRQPQWIPVGECSEWCGLGIQLFLNPI